MSRNNVLYEYLSWNGLYEDQPRQTPLHKSYHSVAWLNFDKTFLAKENFLREQVLWIETKIELFQHNNVQKIWHKKGKGFLPKNRVPTLKHRGSSMMFWRFFLLKGDWTSNCNKRNNELWRIYQNSGWKSTVQNLHLSLLFTFQQDNDPKHTSKSATVWIIKTRLQFCHGLHWVLTWILLKIYGKNWKCK